MPKLPNDSQRLTIVGRTGSGKTQAGVWHLSKRHLQRMPWVIFDFKGDRLINSIELAKHIELGEIPKSPGVYIVHPQPKQDEEIESYLWDIWEHENIGIYVDEGFMMGDNPGLEVCLTQGRSKNIPMIILSQRPVWLSRFAFSEADFYQVFSLNDDRDKQTIESFVPVELIGTRTAEYHSYYYDVADDELTLLTPVPSAEEILKAIDAKLRPRKVNRKLI